MIENLYWLSNLCATAPAAQAGLFLGLFVVGITGSVVHCGPMCGMFVLGQVSERMTRLPMKNLCEWQRFSNGLLLPYHFGRLTTYAGLGAVAARITGLLGQMPWFPIVSASLLLLAALLFLAQALGQVLGIYTRMPMAPRYWTSPIRACAQCITRGSVSGEYLLGLTLGFLPCSFLYAALVAASASAEPLIGAAEMVSFGAGTAPVLMIIGMTGHAAGWQIKRWVTAFAPVPMLLNAGLLIALAWQRLG